jgi:hypothetical protein
MSPLPVQPEHDVHDALGLSESAGTEPEANVDQSVLVPVNFESEAGGSEFDKLGLEVTGVSVWVVGLKIADGTVVILELSLQHDVGTYAGITIVFGSRVLVAERDLEIQVVEIADRDIAGVQFHWKAPG